MITVEQAVQNGIALLNSKGPADWREKVEIEDLDVSSLNWCILGQIYGDYYVGMVDLFPASEESFAGLSELHGFDAMPANDGVRRYGALTDAWIAALS